MLVANYDTIIKILSIDYSSNQAINPENSYSYVSFIKTNKLSSDTIFGGR
jgi:hypothetical protein